MPPAEARDLELLGYVLERVDPTLDLPIPFELSELDRPVPFVLTAEGEAALETFVCEHGFAELEDLEP